MRDFLTLYTRVIKLLAPERRLALGLCAVNILLAVLVFVEPTLFGKIIDVLAGSAGQPLPQIWSDSLFWLGLWGGFGLLGIAANVLVALHADRLAHRRRLAALGGFFTHVLNMPPAFHGSTHSGRLMKVAITGSDQLFHLWLAVFREHLATFVAVAVLVPVALWRNWRLGLLLVLLTSLFAIIVCLVIRRTERRQRRVAEHNTDLAARAGDVLGNVLVVQTFLRHTAETRALDGIMQRLLAAQIPVLSWWAVATTAARAASTITIMCIFALGTWLHVRGLTSVGEIVSYMAFATLLIGRLEHALAFVNRLFLDKDSLKQYFDVLDTRSSIVERADARPMPRAEGTIRFEDVSLSYDGERPAVEGLDFELPPGAKVALVGPTGAGKSTAVALLMRLRDPDRGRILIDGIDLRDVRLGSLRANIGAVFQESLLFNRTIEDNLRVGKPDATAAEIETAARSAEAHDFIIGKPQGYQSLIGERGIGLSGGERQRLAIARALLKDPPILVLDEATSALDARTEAKVQHALRTLLRGRTSIVIAHRLATIRDADLVLVFDHGRIIERGTFAELSAAGGRFAELASLQSGAGSLAAAE